MDIWPRLNCFSILFLLFSTCCSSLFEQILYQSNWKQKNTAEIDYIIYRNHFKNSTLDFFLKIKAEFSYIFQFYLMYFVQYILKIFFLRFIPNPFHLSTYPSSMFFLLINSSSLKATQSRKLKIKKSKIQQDKKITQAKQNMEFVLCWSTTHGYGAWPVMWLTYPVTFHW